MQVVLAALADYAMIDQAGRLSVVGIFSHVWVRRVPSVHPRTHLVVRLVGKRTEIGTHQLRIRFLDPRGEEVLGGEGSFTVGEPPAGVTDVEAGVILAYDLPLPVMGRYTMEISLDGALVTTLPLGVAEFPQVAPQN